MIKQLIRRILRRSSPQAAEAAAADTAAAQGRRVEVPASVHGIDPQLVDERAVKVVTTLQDAGYEAYIVGGAVRDLLLGARPKDFDVATNATPEQVKALFRRAFIIGRRFRIVHVIHGRGRDHEVIEVSTFRATVDTSQAEAIEGNEKTARSELAGRQHAVDASGRVLRDNVWGSQQEDAARRDFTINALYYDPRSGIVVDYHRGIEDSRKRVLRMIGDPVRRYREDPVRIVRVVRFAAKLGFEIDPGTRRPIHEMVGLLDNVPQSRLFDEMLKLLQTGHAMASIAELRKQGLHRGVFPILDAALVEADEARQAFVTKALEDTDRRVAQDKPVAPSFMLACLLWHDVKPRWQARLEAGEHPAPALQAAIDEVFDARIGDISGRGRLAADMREIWMLQPRFERRSGNGPFTMVEQPRFRAGFDFLRLRAECAEVPEELAGWWERFSLADEAGRRELMQAVREAAPRRVRKRAPATQAGAEAGSAAAAAPDDAPPEDMAPDDMPADGGEAAAAPRKRRRSRGGRGRSRNRDVAADGSAAPATASDGEGSTR